MSKSLRSLWRLVVAAAGVLALALAYFFWPPPTTPPVAEPELVPPRRGNEFPALSMDLPVTSDPVLVPASEAVLDDDAIVIGIVMDGEARAYLREAFELYPENHVVSDVVQSREIVVTHCDFQRCTRVLAASRPGESLDIRIGGWRDDQTMELIVKGKRYSQKAADIPLAEIPSTETTWGEWRKLHPETVVFVGDVR